MAKTADGTIRIDVKALTSSYEKALKRAGASAVAFGIVAAEAIRLAATEIAKMVPEVMDLRNELSDASTKSGVMVTTLAGMRNAAEGAGLEFSNLESALTQFPKRLADVARGTGEAKVAFKGLVIEATNADGSLRSADDVLKEFLSKVQKVKDPTTRAALATQAFTEAGGNLLLALSGGELEAHIAFAERYGADIGPQAAKAAADWQRGQAELNTVMGGLKASIVDILKPTERLDNLMLGATATWAGFAEIAGYATKIIEIQKYGLLSLRAAWEGNWDEVERLSAKTRDVVDSFRLPSQAAAEAGAEFFILRQRMRGSADATANAAINMRDLGAAVQGAKLDIQGFIKTNEDLSKKIDEVFSSEMSAQEQLRLAAYDRALAIAKIGEETGRTAEAQMAAAIIINQAEDEITRLKTEAFLERKSLYDEEMALRVDGINQIRDAEKRAAEEKAASQQAQLDATMGLASMLSSVFADAAAQQAQLGEAGKKRAKVQFAASKALSIGVAMMNTAQGVTAALAMYPPNLVLAGIVGAAGAVQVGTIAAQKPSFHIGSRAARNLAPDERQATITQSETVLTAQGAAAANAGISPRAQDRWVLQLGTDAFDAQVRLAQHTGGRFSQATTGRSRIGHRVSR